MINIILADDHTIVREGIKLLLESDQELNITAEAISGLQVLKLLEDGCEADILLTDLDMPELDGRALVREMRNRYPHIKVIILTMSSSDDVITNAFVNGAYGYLLKTTDSEEIIYAIKHVKKGKKYLCSELSQHYYEKSKINLPVHSSNEPTVELTEREKELLDMIAEGLTNSEISDKLFLSKRTVEGKRQELLKKTGCRNTASLIKYAVMNRIIGNERKSIT